MFAICLCKTQQVFSGYSGQFSPVLILVLFGTEYSTFCTFKQNSNITNVMLSCTKKVVSFLSTMCSNPIAFVFVTIGKYLKSLRSWQLHAFSYPEPFLRAVNRARRGALAKSISNWHLIGYNEGYCSNTRYILLPCFYGIRFWIWPEPLVAPGVRRALGTRMGSHALHSFT